MKDQIEDRVKKDRSQKTIGPSQKIKGAGAAIIALFIVAGLWLGRDQAADLLALLKDRETLAASLDSLGGWGPLLYVLILSAQTISAVIPGHALMIAAGYLYGFAGGFTLNLIGAVGASQLAFVLARVAGKPAVYRFMPDKILTRWQAITERRGIFFFLLLSFWFPIIPSSATNYLAGLTSIPFGLFFVANLLGRLPGLLLITLIGSHGVEFSWRQWAVIIGCGLLAIGLGRYLTMKLEQSLERSRSLE